MCPGSLLETLLRSLRLVFCFRLVGLNLVTLLSPPPLHFKMCSISLSLKSSPVSHSPIRVSPVRRRPSVVVAASAGGSTRIHKLIEKEGVVLMPGCYDALSAAIVEKTGFTAGFISGYALSASLLAKPDFGLLTSLSLSHPLN